MSMSEPPAVPSPWSHRFAWALAAATLLLVFIGGLVTSTHSGLTVPDWPLSYGRFMPPMIGGILFEHGHRLAAASVGLLTIALNLVFWKKEPRAWVRRAANGALGLVVLQGLFGGLTVLLRLPKAVSITHACLAQTFFGLSVALVVWTSRAWRERSPSVDGDPANVALPHVALLLFLTLYAQLILGAVVRHTGHAAGLHIANAGLILLGMGWVFRRLSLGDGTDPRLWRLASVLALAYVVQVVLGTATLLSLLVPRWIASPVRPVVLATSHVMTGALLLGLSAALTLLSWRGRPVALGRFRDYVTLTKPGISAMAAVTALAGFFLGSGGRVGPARLFHTVVGTLLVSGGACALNMLLERDVDARMHRTENRPLPARRLNPGEALFLGALLAVAGVLYLSAAVNSLTAVIAGLTLCVYLYVYTPLKKISALNTLFGAAAGALPPVIGWSAAAGRLNPGAWVLFAILFFWQYPHFFSLAWLYRADYARAGLAMLPAVEPDGETTARHMVVTTLALTSVSLLPTFLGLAGTIYFGAAFLMGLGLLGLSFVFFRQHSDARARRVFLASVLYLPALLAILVLDRRGVL